MMDDKLSFNFAARYTEVISEYLYEFELSWSNGNYTKATWALKKVWHKLGVWLDDKENNIIRKKFIMVQINLRDPNQRVKVSNDLEALGLHIGKKLNDKGLLIPTSSDPRFMFRKK